MFHENLFSPKYPSNCSKPFQIGLKRNSWKGWKGCSLNINNHALGFSARLASIQFWLNQSNDNVQLGNLGERLVHGLLVSQGWKAEITANHRHAGDITATNTDTGEIVIFEVKTARQNDSLGRWNFCINKANKTSCSHSDFVVLLAIDKHRTIYKYLIPASLLEGTAQIIISSHPTRYRGKMAAFRMQGDLIDVENSLDIYQLIKT